MNEEQFEEEMCALEDCGHDDFVEALRARDTAQREALARVEADGLKQWQAGRDGMREERDAWIEKCQQYQAQLAEALGLLNSSHKKLRLRIFDCEHLQKVDAFLARHAQAEQQEAPIPEYFQEACDKFDWTPEEALRLYAEGKHFDTDRGRTRILDTGAIASNALKHASLPYLEMKGDAELSELRTAVGAKQEAQGAQAGDLVSAVRVLLEVPQLRGEQAFSAQPIIDRVRATLATQPAAIKLPDRKRTDHLSADYKTMTPTRASIESYNRALDDVAALNAVRGAEHDQ